MNEEEKAGRAIARLLNDGLGDITPGTRYSLQTARRAALEHYQSAERILHTGSGLSIQGGYQWFSNHAGRVLLTASLLLFLAVHGYWQKHQRAEDTSINAPSILTTPAPAPTGSEISDDTTDDITPDEETASTASAARESGDGSVSEEDAGYDDNDVDVVPAETESRDADEYDETTDVSDTDAIPDTEENTADESYAAEAAQDSTTGEDAKISDDYSPESEGTVDTSDVSAGDVIDTSSVGDASAR